MINKAYIKLVSLLLVIATLISLTACGRQNENEGTPPWINPELPDPNGELIQEGTITEETISELLISEIYLKELVSAENEISALLLDDELIDDVLLCKTIFIPDSGIGEFAENSRTEQLFGGSVDIEAMAEQISIGHGIIVTLVVVRRSGIPVPLAGIVISHATEDVELESSGGESSSLLGSIVGSEVDVEDLERTAAMLIFAKSTVSIVMSIVSLVTLVPSGGASAVGVMAGVKIGFSAVSMISAAVNTFKATDAVNVDWDNVNWSEVGLYGAQQAVKDSGDGYVWGTAAGPILGGEDGYEDYLKFGAFYSSLEQRQEAIPSETSLIGVWSGERGESDFILHDPIRRADGSEIDRIAYRNGIPDFSGCEIIRIGVSGMTDDRGANSAAADEALAKLWTEEAYNGRGWTAEEVSIYRDVNALTWHEMNNMEYMQLIPCELGEIFTGLCGCDEYRAMKSAFESIISK